jgi:hypothetical protein
VLNAKAVFLSFLLILTTGCSELFPEKEGDFEFSCSRWGETIILCEEDVATDPLTGHIKLYYFQDDPYYDTALFLCGANLDLNTGHIIQDGLANRATKGELLCSNADEDDLKWEWQTETCLNVTWDNLYLELEIPKCPFDERLCVVEGFGYISVE